jgi:beta-xylosidase
MLLAFRAAVDAAITRCPCAFETQVGVCLRVGGRWLMMLSEGMENQHLATAESTDLIHWKPLGTVEIADQPLLAFRHGAPFVWEEDGLFYMILMDEENADHRSSLGFFSPATEFTGSVRQ